MNQTQLKRKYGIRPGWNRIKHKETTSLFVSEDSFVGHVTLLKMNKVEQPLFVQYNERKICIVDDGYCWVQQFPENANHSVTTMFDQNGKVVQWYIDICKRNGYSEEHGPYLDDLYLDLIYLPTGDIIEKDIQELEDALNKKVIKQEDYLLAWREFHLIKARLTQKEFILLEQSIVLKEVLLDRLSLNRC